MRKLVLWGHHVDEYRDMFGLEESDLQGRLLEYGCGTSAVNAELLGLGRGVVSCDPMFSLDGEALYSQVFAAFEETVARLEKEPERFKLSRYKNVNALVDYRKQGVETFFGDYASGKREGRYVALANHSLPFEGFSFDLALSSYFLLADLDEHDIDSNIAGIMELARVAKEVRIFPLMDRTGKVSPFLGPVLLGLQQHNFGMEVREVKYHLLPMENAMLRVWAQQCAVEKQ